MHDKDRFGNGGGDWVLRLTINIGVPNNQTANRARMGAPVEGLSYEYVPILITNLCQIGSMNKIIMTLATLVAITTVLAVPAHADIPEEVRVGSVLPLTGGYSSVGIQVDDATELAINDFNAYLDEMDAGWQFVHFAENSESNPVAALDRVTTLKAKGVDIIFGPAGSGRVNGVIGYTNENNMLVLSCCSTAPSLAIEDDSVYRIVADDRNQGKAIGKLLESSGIEVVVPVWIGDTYGDGLKAEIVNDFESRGGMADEGIRYNPDTVEFSVSVGSLADTVQDYVDEYGEDKVAIAIVAFDEIVSILQAAQSYPVLGDIQWFGSETIADSTALQQDRLAREFASDVGFTAVQVDVDVGDKALHVREALADVHGDTPNVFVYTGYDAVWLVGLSIIAANSADVDDIKAVLHDVANDYSSGALRSTALNEAGDLATGNYGIRIMDDGVWTRGDIYYSDTDTIPTPIPEGTTVFAGSLLPLTGGYSSVGVQVNAATVLAVEHFNEYLIAKNAGWELVLFQENTASNPVIALEKTQALHSRGADVLFGPAGSSRVKNVMSYVNDNNMILLSCCSTSTELAVEKDRVFRVVADDANQGKAFGILLAHEGIEVAVPMWIGDSYGDSLRNAAISEFEERGGMSDEGIRYNPDVREFSVSVDALASTVQKYVDSHGADKVAIVVVAFDEIVSILQSADRYPVLKEVKWYGSETLAQNAFIVKDRIARDFATEVEFSAIQVPLGDGPRAQGVTDALSIPFGGTPNAFAYNAYDAVWLAGLSIERSGSTDPTDIAEILPSLAASYVTGALSSTQLNEAGDLALAIYGTWLIDESGDWYVDEVVHIDDESVVPFQ